MRTKSEEMKFLFCSLFQRLLLPRPVESTEVYERLLGPGSDDVVLDGLGLGGVGFGEFVRYYRMVRTILRECVFDWS